MKTTILFYASLLFSAYGAYAQTDNEENEPEPIEHVITAEQCYIGFSADAGAITHEDQTPHKCKTLLIYSLPPVSVNPIDIQVNFDIRGIYNFKRDSNLLIPADQCVFIEDLFTGKFFDLKSTQSFSFTINHATRETRFLLHVNKPVSKMTFAPACSYKQNGKAIVKTNLPGKWDYTWKDAIGNTLTVHSDLGKSDTLKNLAPGIYHIIATSNNAFCSMLSDSVVVKGTAQIKINPIINNNTCSNGKQGQINASDIEGGTAPFNYKWSNAQSGAIIKNLSSAVYILNLSDANGCKDTSYYVIHKQSNLAFVKNFPVIGTASNSKPNELSLDKINLSSSDDLSLFANENKVNNSDLTSGSKNNKQILAQHSSTQAELLGSSGFYVYSLITN